MLTDVDYFSIEYIVCNMRESDAIEIFALQDHDSRLRLAAEATYAIRNKGRGKIAWHKGRPAAVAAFVEIRTGVWEVWSFGTDDYTACVFTLMRWLRETARDIIATRQAHRLQCHSRFDHHEAHKLIRAMGAVPEGPPLRAFGKDGSDYQAFVWWPNVNDQILQRHYKRPQETNMCFGSKSSAPAVPAPSPPTTFSYTAADKSNDQRQKAAMIASTTGQSQEGFGSELSAGSSALGSTGTGGA